MNYLLDTCVLAEFKKKQPEQNVLDWLNSKNEQSLFLGVITIGEMQKGISVLPSSKKRRSLETWLQNLIYRYDNRILDLGLMEMFTRGNLNGKLAKNGIAFPFIDSLIAATVLANEMTLVTRNESDFKNTGVKILNIWK